MGVIDAMNNDYSTYREGYTDGYRIGKRDAMHWIPCSERLPEKYGWYMCTLKDCRVNTYYWNNKGEWIDNGKKHFFELYNISSRYTGEDITAEQEGSVYWTDWVIAWMPLPEPYREVEHEST